MLVANRQTQRYLHKLAVSRGLIDGGPLWPTRYADLTGECAFRFLTECWHTLDEAEQKIGLVPAKPFIEAYAHLWVDAYRDRTPLVVEKSRRMVVSWAARGLETWAMGLKRGEWLIVDQTHSNAAEHLWRVGFAYEQMLQKRPDMKLRPALTRGAMVIKQPTHVILPNGSVFTQAHQDAGAAQGKGKTGITLEELSKYQYPTSFWNQSLLVVQGPGGRPGGFVNAIANADPNQGWKAIKEYEKPRILLGLPPIA